MTEEQINDQARKLFHEGALPTAIFRCLLQNESPPHTSRMLLLARVEDVFEIGVSDFMRGAARWNLWESENDQDDETVNKKLEGKLRLKQASSSDASTEKN